MCLAAVKLRGRSQSPLFHRTYNFRISNVFFFLRWLFKCDFEHEFACYLLFHSSTKRKHMTWFEAKTFSLQLFVITLIRVFGSLNLNWNQYLNWTNASTETIFGQQFCFLFWAKIENCYFDWNILAFYSNVHTSVSRKRRSLFSYLFVCLFDCWSNQIILCHHFLCLFLYIYHKAHFYHFYWYALKRMKLRW